MTISYSARFQTKDAVESYDAQEYAAGGYSASIWQLQRPFVENFLSNFRRLKTRPNRLLDFACGTGRVLACVEQFADKADGIDISENMIAVARTKCRHAQLQVGDILASPELLQKDYDVITCFRLLLNLEPEMRGRILRQLRSVIKASGRLLVNVHGNSRSSRHPAIVWRRWRERTQKTGAMLNEMSPAETERLLWECGFQIVRKFGFGILPPLFYRTALRPAAFAIDSFLAGENGLKNWSVDIIYICRPR
ncbi:MAG: class I SAM-dependent methyltransferase [Verrucomicrobiota bacterium]|jgi:SAM-dependent methyltransferase